MYLSGFKQTPYLMVKPNSDLDNINPEFLENKYIVRLSGEYEDSFINKFTSVYHNLHYLDISNKYDENDNSFIYEFHELKGLVISLFRDSDFILDCSRLPKSIHTLNLSIWAKKKIKNIEALNDTNLEHLHLSDFDEADLSKISKLKKLKSLSICRAKIKSLKGIESLINLEFLALGAVRSLTDISDIISLKKLRRINFDICPKLQDFSPISKLPEIEILELQDCKNLASIKFVSDLPKLKRLITLGTTVINDFDTTPAKNVPIFWGSHREEYNVHYPEKEIK